MSREHVKGVIDYFRGDQWRALVTEHLEHPGEEVYHAHVYVDTNVHAKSLERIMFAYWEIHGRPITRSIDPQSPKPNVVALHGVHPKGLPHFDFCFRYNKDEVLAPMPPDVKEAENGKNLISWGKFYQDDFIKQFQFKSVGPTEDQIIRDYFLTKHWKQTLEHVMDPRVTHFHGNFEINFDPKVLELYAIEALSKIGWIVEKAVPCVYDVHGVYTGKNVFLIGWPEKVFDMCWKFDPDVVLKVSETGWINGTPKWDEWYIDAYNNVLAANPFYVMTDEEINEVIASFEK